MSYAQHHYDIDVVWKDESKPLEINQTITWVNTSEKPLQTIYILDWNHAYSSERSPLGKFLANEFDYSLIRASKQKRSMTNIVTLRHKDGEMLWSRLPDKIDVIKASLPYPVAPNESFRFTATFTLQLPDAGMFKFGQSNHEIFAQHWHLLLGELSANGTWTVDSNLGFGMPNTPKASASYSLDMPMGYTRILPQDTALSHSPLVLTKRTNYNRVPFGDSVLLTDMIPTDSLDAKTQEGLEKIYTFLDAFFDFDTSFVYRALQKEYSQKPLLALESMPQFVGAFKKDQVITLKLLKILLEQCVYHKYGKQQSSSEWLVEGLPYFLWQQFVNKHYPNLKTTGNLNTWPVIKNYHFTQAPYYRSLELAANVSTNTNRGQSLTTPPEGLTRYNRRIANPNRAALALLYLDDYLDKTVLLNSLKQLPKSSRLDSILKTTILTQTQKPIGWFFEHYIHQNNNGDFSVKGKKLSESTYQVAVSSTQKHAAVPLHLTYKNGDEKTFWLPQSDLPYQAVYDKKDVESITLNKNHLIPEWSSNNNSFNPNKRFFRNNLRLRLLQDIPQSGTAILLVSPEVGYNLYDGILSGITIGNSSILSNRLRYSFSPQYGITSKQLNGSGYVVASTYKQDASLYLTRYTLFGSSYHYAPKKRYTVYSPSVQFFFRPKGLQNNQRSYLHFRHISVRLQELEDSDTRKNYGVSLASFHSRSGTALKNLFYKTELQWASQFKKVSAEAEHITYYLPNRRWNFRVFGGVFLQNQANDPYFDFNASRINDYLFQYDLYGRSESEGFFSQQYIKAEGGLRTTGNISSANRWIISAQTSTTLWRWIEGYAEIGWIKNVDQNPHTHWGTGISLNIIPDFFEMHFPLYDATGNLMTKNNYATQIRFQLSLRPASLVRLFSRSWF